MSLEYFITQTELVFKLSRERFNSDTDRAEEEWVNRYAKLYHEEWKLKPELRQKFEEYFWNNFIKNG